MPSSPSPGTPMETPERGDDNPPILLVRPDRKRANLSGRQLTEHQTAFPSPVAAAEIILVWLLQNRSFKQGIPMFPSDRFNSISRRAEIFILSHQAQIFFVFFLNPETG